MTAAQTTAARNYYWLQKLYDIIRHLDRFNFQSAASKVNLFKVLVMSIRVEIDTENSPFRINRTVHPSLQNYIPAAEWTIFCDNIDEALPPMEAVSAKLSIFGIAFTILYIGIVAGIVCNVVLVDDSSLYSTLWIVLVSADVVVIMANVLLYRALVKYQMNPAGDAIQEICTETSFRLGSISMLYLRSNLCLIVCRDSVDAAIDISVIGQGASNV
jgi:hypothetical protein